MSSDRQKVKGPAPRPCESCPYRTDVPSGVWEAEEYAKLVDYDAPTYAQPAAIFLCHQHDAGDSNARLCAGWVGCHGDELLSLRLAAATGSITDTTAKAAFAYRSPVALFPSGAAAAAHGRADLDRPGPSAAAVVDKISRRRNTLM